MGAMVDYIVPNRFEYGYGLTPEIVGTDGARKIARHHRHRRQRHRQHRRRASKRSGAASTCVITDHHLPADRCPPRASSSIPNQPECGFPSKHLAGVGVVFYVLLALRAELRRRGVFDAQTQPKLDNLLDLVALGTVADVVRLDRQQPHPGRAGPQAHARRAHACRAWRRCSGWPGAKRAAPRRSTSASRWGRA